MWDTDVGYIKTWLDSLDDDSAIQVVAAIELLAERGPALKRPLAGKVEGSRFKAMKELRPGSSGRSEIRILFAFDPRRTAVMLLAGDKRRSWSGWYKRAIPEADRRFQEHLDTLRGHGA